MGNILKSKLFWVVGDRRCCWSGCTRCSASTPRPASCAARPSSSSARSTGASSRSARSASIRSSCRPRSRTCRCPDTDGKPMLGVPPTVRRLRAVVAVAARVRLQGRAARCAAGARGHPTRRRRSTWRTSRCRDARGSRRAAAGASGSSSSRSVTAAVQFADLARHAPFERQFAPVNFKLEDFRTTPEGGDFRPHARKTQNARTSTGRARQFALATAGLVVGRIRDRPTCTCRASLEVSRRRTALRDPAGRDRTCAARTASRSASRCDSTCDLPQMRDQRPDRCARGVSNEDYVSVPTVVIGDTQVAMPAKTVSLGHDRGRRRQGRRLDDAGRLAQH